MGVTVLVSSGDDGASNFGCACNSNKAVSYLNCACGADSSSSVGSTSWSGQSWKGSGYFPSFPSTCPWVTSVGGTMGADAIVPARGSKEIACQSQENGVITTGGGFSTYYPMPSWQKDAAQRYLSKTRSRVSDGYNPRGRGFPDLSLSAVKYQVMIADTLVGLYGTSASAPVAAAFGERELKLSIINMLLIYYLCLCSVASKF